MGIKKWTRSINESNKTDESIESLKDSLTTISDDFKLDIDKYGPKSIRIKIEIEIRTIGNYSGYINSPVSISDIEDISKVFIMRSTILNRFNEAMMRSSIEHDTITLEILKNQIIILIHLL